MKFNINLEKGEYLDAIKRTPSNQIFLFDNLISEKHCDQIVKELQDSDLLYEPDHNIGTHVKCHFLPPSKNCNISSHEYMLSILRNFAQYIKSKYLIFNIHDFCGPTYRKIHGSTAIHTDGVMECDHLNPVDAKPRMLGIIGALNDNYSGGEIVFPQQKFKIKLKKGQAIVFPPYWTHPHYTTELENDTIRYTFNTWYYSNAVK